MGTKVTASGPILHPAHMRQFVCDALLVLPTGGVVEVETGPGVAAQYVQGLLRSVTRGGEDKRGVVVATPRYAVPCGASDRGQTWSTRRVVTAEIRLHTTVPGHTAGVLFSVSDPELIELCALGALDADFLYSSGPGDAEWFGPRGETGEPHPPLLEEGKTGPRWEAMRRRLGSGASLVWAKTELLQEASVALSLDFGKPISHQVSDEGVTVGVRGFGGGTGLAVTCTANNFTVLSDGIDAGVEVNHITGIPLTPPLAYTHAVRHDRQWMFVRDRDGVADCIEIAGDGHFVLAVLAERMQEGLVTVLEYHGADLQLWRMERIAVQPGPGDGMAPPHAAYHGWDRVGIKAFHPMVRGAYGVVLLVLDRSHGECEPRLEDALRLVPGQVDVFVPVGQLMSLRARVARHRHFAIADADRGLPVGGATSDGAAVVVAPTFVAFREAVARFASWGFGFDEPQSRSPRIGSPGLDPLPDRRVPRPFVAPCFLCCPTHGAHWRERHKRLHRDTGGAKAPQFPF